MATKNLKKVVRKIYLNAKEKDKSNQTFNPMDYPANWNNAIKYIQAKDRRMAFNNIFKPLFKKTFAADIKMYQAAGHKLSYGLRKQIKENAKQKAKETTKTQLAVKAAIEQSGKGQE